MLKLFKRQTVSPIHYLLTINVQEAAIEEYLISKIKGLVFYDDKLRR